MGLGKNHLMLGEVVGAIVMILKTLVEFFRSESGAISIDFLMLTGLVVSFGISVAVLVGAGINPMMASMDLLGTPVEDFNAKFVSVDEQR